MNEVPREKLCKLISKYGESLCDEPLKCEGLLRDLCGQYRLEINVLIDAIKERITADLRSSSQSVPIEVTLARLTNRFQDHRGATSETARWVVESWALALGKISATQLTKPKESAAPKTVPSVQQARPTTDQSLRAARKPPATSSYQQPERKAPYRTKDYDAIPPQAPPERESRWPVIALGMIVLVAVAAFAGWWFGVKRQQPAPQTISSPTPATVAQASPPPTATPAPTAIATATAIQAATNPFGATRDHPWVNSLGMKFVPVPGTHVLFSIWDTRVQDYQAFVNATERKQWPNPHDFEQGPTHPAVHVSWEDAKAFCTWLTERERKEGKIGQGQEYRLPTDAEWSVTVGLPKESGRTPQEKGGKIKEVYPWGSQWPPPKGAGNYDRDLNVDEYPDTSPVGSFEPNKFGLYDMGGNVWQWCEDWYNDRHIYRVLRGGAWHGSDPAYLISSYRYNVAPEQLDDVSGFRCVLVVESSR